MDSLVLINLLQKNELPLIEKYIERGIISVNETIGVGEWPLLVHAIVQGVSIGSLLRLGADVNVTFNGHWTPLHIACAKKASEEIIVALIEAGADVNAKTNTGYTPLHMACFVGFHDGICILIGAGADVDTTNDDGDSPRDTALATGCVGTLDSANGGRATKAAIH